MDNAMTKHTPGPWKAQKPRGHQRAIHRKWEIVSTYLTNGEMIVVGEHTGIDCLRESDARLIAAAPELLAVLIDVREAWLNDRLGDVEGILTGDVCANAIAKATGEDK